MKRILAIILLLQAAAKLMSQPIQLRGAEMTYTEVDGKKVIQVKQASFDQQGSTVTCDLADYDKQSNVVYCSGNVVVTETSGTRVTGSNLRYDGNQKLAYMTGNVVLTDKNMTLTTTAINYNTATKTGSYSNGAKIVDGDNVLTSGIGIYSSEARMLYFRKNVVLVNPEYTMKSDTLQYNTSTGTAYFYGPTVITSDDNTIRCRYGWYNTRTGYSSFSKQATLENKENTIIADTLSYSRNEQYGYARGNIQVTDTVQQVEVWGDRAHYYRAVSRTLVTGRALARKVMDGDSLLLSADTFLYFRDTAGGRFLSAYRRVKLFKEDLAGLADSLVYAVDDSLFRLYRKPVLWNEENQVSSDSMWIFIRNKRIHALKMRGNSSIVQWDDTGRFNQVMGADMDNSFRNNKLDRVMASGGVRSLYYIRENDTLYTGVNYMLCQRMKVSFDSGRISSIQPYGNPEGTVYPVNELPEEKRMLEGFSWMEDQRPVREQFLIIRRQKEVPVKQAPAAPKTPAKAPGKSKNKKSAKK